MAAYTGQLTVYHTGPASRGTRRATAVKPRTTGAQSGVKGYYPLREP